MTMKRSPHNRWLHAPSILFAAMPFGFALIRAVRTGHDFRYLWVALAAFCGAAAVIAVAGPYDGRPYPAVAVSTMVFAIATVFAVLAALLLGTTLGLGILVVASSFGFCFAVGCLLHLLRARSS